MFFLDLSNPTNATIAVPEGTATIISDDAQAVALFGNSFNGDIYQIDPVTAASTLVGGTGLAGLQGLTTGPGNTVYGTTQTTRGLYTIDVTTATATLIGTLAPPTTNSVEGDLGYDLANDVIYAAFTGPSPELVQIDPMTGATTELGDLLTGGTALAGTNINIDAMEFRGTELFAVISDGLTGADAALNDDLLRIDLTTREVTSIGDLGVDLPFGGAGMTYDAVNDVFLVVGTDSAGANPMYSVDPTTGVAAFIGDTMIPVNAGLAFGASQVVVPTEVSISDVTVAEGNIGTSTATFTLTLSQAASSAVTVQYSTIAASAVAGTDFTASTGTATFTAGQTTQTVIVDVSTDIIAENDEVFFLQLTNPSGASLGDALGIATIVDEDFDNSPNTLLGGDGDDTIVGGAGDDFINGMAGDDSISGGDGNDTVLGGSGRDTIDGGTGDDSLDGQGGADSVSGGDGDDEIIFEGDEDGNDTIFGGNGADTVTVNTGVTDDTLVIAQDALGRVTVTEGSSTLVVDPSISTVNVNGQAGTDMITVGDLNGVSLSALTVDGGAGPDTIDATGLISGSVRVRLRGGDANDTITGGISDDSLFGDAGDDSIDGGAGNDSRSRVATATTSSTLRMATTRLTGEPATTRSPAASATTACCGGLDGDTLVGNEGDDTLRRRIRRRQPERQLGQRLTADGSFGRDSISGG